MLNIVLKGHNYKYEISEFLRLFTSSFDFIEDVDDGIFERQIEDSEDVKASELSCLANKLDIDLKDQKIYIRSTTYAYECGVRVYYKSTQDTIDLKEKKFANNQKKIDNRVKTISKRLIQRSMFDYLNDKYDANVPWGILTGIRPVKLIHSHLDEGIDESTIRDTMKREYLISDEKLDLIIDIAKRERPYIYPLDGDKISLYVSIPFCPTRCLYCSFPSNALGIQGSKRGQYVDTLLVEAEGLADIITKQGKTIESFYIGGGTPTALEANDLDRLITGLFDIFDLSRIEEFTVEAGRPDTITREKLLVLKKHGVGRISINPQTMNQVTLDKIGRCHSAEDIVDCFNMARELGFDNINMDLILGLPNETPDMVAHTMNTIVGLNPENVTVHTLALKRASDLKINIEDYEADLTSYRQMVEMIKISRDAMAQNGYNPYYMYRQKHMLGNLENIGYAKEGKECLYNMQIMEEKQSNYAIGAGAVSKFVYLDENRIERVDDVKDLDHYLSRVDEMIEKKRREVEKNEN